MLINRDKTIMTCLIIIEKDWDVLMHFPGRPCSTQEQFDIIAPEGCSVQPLQLLFEFLPSQIKSLDIQQSKTIQKTQNQHISITVKDQIPFLLMCVKCQVVKRTNHPPHKTIKTLLTIIQHMQLHIHDGWRKGAVIKSSP